MTISDIAGGYSTVVVCILPKDERQVRFPLPAPRTTHFVRVHGKPRCGYCNMRGNRTGASERSNPARRAIPVTRSSSFRLTPQPRARRSAPAELLCATLVGTREDFERCADVAQLVEQCFRKAWVGGSNPLIGSMNHSRSLSRYSGAPVHGRPVCNDWCVPNFWEPLACNCY